MAETDGRTIPPRCAYAMIPRFALRQINSANAYGRSMNRRVTKQQQETTTRRNALRNAPSSGIYPPRRATALPAGQVRSPTITRDAAVPVWSAVRVIREMSEDTHPWRLAERCARSRGGRAPLLNRRHHRGGRGFEPDVIGAWNGASAGSLPLGIDVPPGTKAAIERFGSCWICWERFSAGVSGTSGVTRIAAHKLVRPRGLEPPRVAPLAPQASASTNSATAAGG